jgi:CRISPR-associated exonuclease Cas4
MDVLAPIGMDSDREAGNFPTGTEVNYLVLCPRKLWWFGHGIEQEHVEGNVGAENVSIGRTIHEDSFASAGARETMIDGRLRIDFAEDGVVHEVKKSRGGDRATRMQVIYYLWYLKHRKGIETTGVIHYPKEKRTSAVALTPQAELEIERIVAQVAETKAMTTPPKVDAPMKLCAKCSYQDLCWG